MQCTQNHQMKALDGMSARSSNIELYRVIVMMAIIAHHYVVNSGLTNSDGPIYKHLWSLRSQFLLIFGAFGKSGINCFTIISGYYMCTSRITLRKYCKLLIQIEFYKILFFVIFLTVGREMLSVARIIKLLLPASSLGTGYTGCFVLFYLLIPFLNILIHSLSKKQHFALVAYLVFMHSGIALLPDATVTFNYVSWFCVIYLVGAYIRLYPAKHSDNTMFWFWMTLASLCLSVISVIYRSRLHVMQHSGLIFKFLSDSHKILALTNGITSFMLIKNLKIPYSRVINSLGAASFGVLLIHANSAAMRTWLWKDLLKNTQMYASQWLPLHAIGSVVAIYAVCTGIEWVRICLIEKPLLKFWDMNEDIIANVSQRMIAEICKKCNLEE